MDPPYYVLSALGKKDLKHRPPLLEPALLYAGASQRGSLFSCKPLRSQDIFHGVKGIYGFGKERQRFAVCICVNHRIFQFFSLRAETGAVSTQQTGKI